MVRIGRFFLWVWLGVTYSYDRRLAASPDWPQLERMAKASTRKVEAMFARSSGPHWSWSQNNYSTHSGGIEWAVESSILAEMWNHAGHGDHLPPMPQVGLQYGALGWPELLGTEWDGRGPDPKGPWDRLDFDITGDFKPTGPMTDNHFRWGARHLQMFERTSKKLVAALEEYLDDAFFALED